MSDPAHYEYPFAVDLSEGALAEAARWLGPSFFYELTIGDYWWNMARTMLRQISADAVGNPFAPYVNLRIDTTIVRTRWVLSANGKTWGSTSLL